MPKIHPILLAGGSGTRLWPLSRKSYPKQFSKLAGKDTLFQATAQRMMSSNEINFVRPLTITNADFRFIACEQLQQVGIDPGAILIEPMAKNTAAAILATSLYKIQEDEEATLLVAPTDHLIPDVNKFHEAVKVGLSYAQNGKVVVFGVEPDRPETGYGYLELEHQALDVYGTSALKNFVEKPDLANAKNMYSSGSYLWNAGIFLFKAKDMIDAFRLHDPKTLDLVARALADATEDLGFLRIATDPWAKLDDISIDYAIMEKIRNLVAIPYKSNWSDLGGWDAVWTEGKHDVNGNVVSKAAHAVDCKNSLLRSDSDNLQLVGMGLDNIIAIAMNDAVLVADRYKSQGVKRVVELLKEKGIQQAEVFPKDHRPWGWFESLALGDRFQVKRIFVKPGAALSLQSHKYRSEHWIVVQGSAKVTIDKTTKLINEGESVYVPLGAVHRMENLGSQPMILIEVQIGTYLGEDDIIRYEDIYARD